MEKILSSLVNKKPKNDFFGNFNMSEFARHSAAQTDQNFLANWLNTKGKQFKVEPGIINLVLGLNSPNSEASYGAFWSCEELERDHGITQRDLKRSLAGMRSKTPVGRMSIMDMSGKFAGFGYEFTLMKDHKDVNSSRVYRMLFVTTDFKKTTDLQGNSLAKPALFARFKGVVIVELDDPYINQEAAGVACLNTVGRLK